MDKRADGVWRVEKALREKVGPRAADVMHEGSRHLAGLSLHEVARSPGGNRIVLAMLDKIVLQAAKKSG